MTDEEDGQYDQNPPGESSFTVPVPVTIPELEREDGRIPRTEIYLSNMTNIDSYKIEKIEDINMDTVEPISVSNETSIDVCSVISLVYLFLVVYASKDYIYKAKLSNLLYIIMYLSM